MNKNLQIILIIVALPVSACARISGIFTCNDLFEKSDIVVKGEVISVKDNGPLDMSPLNRSAIEIQAQQFGANELEAKFRVDRVMSGTLSERNIIVNFYKVTRPHASNADMVFLTRHEYVILFLKKSSKGYTLADLGHGKFPASNKMGRNPNARGKDGVSDECSSLLEESDSNLVREGIKCLGELGEVDKYLSKLKQLKDSKNPSVRRMSLIWLARSGDNSATNDMVALVSSSETLTAEEWLDFQDAIRSFSEQKRYDMAPSISQLLKHGKTGVRLAAVRFFRKLKDKQFIPQIVPLLDDHDVRVQYNALMMICEAVRPNKEGCPSTILFDPNPSKYISEWKAWWELNQSK
ncbi:MAG: hypothetical protein KKH28_00875 [Elusimicrobia bacterium]|nr:hypothetical protein [Elusimicrobiota bacterium]